LHGQHTMNLIRLSTQYTILTRSCVHVAFYKPIFQRHTGYYDY